jgi:hypothetical protein
MSPSAVHRLSAQPALSLAAVRDGEGGARRCESPSDRVSHAAVSADGDDKEKILSEALRGADWGRRRAILTRWCFVALQKRSWEDAEDVASEAIARVLDPVYADWDPTKEPLRKHLENVARGILSNRRRTRRTWEVPTTRDEIEERVAEHDAENHVAEQKLAADVLAAVCARVEDDALAREVLALYARGVESLDEHAFALDAPKHEARNARRRLQTHAYAATRALLGDES